jgi:hypothetical protein
MAVAPSAALRILDPIPPPEPSVFSGASTAADGGVSGGNPLCNPLSPDATGQSAGIARKHGADGWGIAKHKGEQTGETGRKTSPAHK